MSHSCSFAARRNEKEESVSFCVIFVRKNAHIFVQRLFKRFQTIFVILHYGLTKMNTKVEHLKHPSSFII